MNLTCEACHKEFEIADETWPGDTVPCAGCGGPVKLGKAKTMAYATNTPLLELSPGQEHRPERLEEGEILAAGTMLGQYRIERFIGRGGMGTVYQARHAMLNRTVAIKVLPPKLARDREFVDRFRREALALANLAHPHIVAIHDMGTQGEIYFFVMEFVDGVNLRDVLVERKMAPEQALRLVPQLCDALDYAHSKGIIHRDIKPENIMIDRSGVAKIGDFGLAKIVKGETSVGSLTNTNVVMGTLEYMAPEQRDSLKGVDHRADIFSMGVVLYEMLTGTLPVGNFEPASRKVAVDVRIDDIVLKALEERLDRRYQRASQMGTDVEEVRAGTPARKAELTLVDASGGTPKVLATLPGRALEVRTEGIRVRLVGVGEKDEFSIGAAGGGCMLKTEDGRPVLHVTGGASTALLMAPKGVDLKIRTIGAEVFASKFSGNLEITTKGGDVPGDDLEGRIRIDSGGGDITLNGLCSEDGEIRSDGGDLNVARLRVARGRVSIDSGGGDAAVGVTSDSSARYQLYSEGGDIEVDGRDRGDEDSVVGMLGAGAAMLSIRSGGGEISLSTVRTEGASVRVHFDAREFWNRLSKQDREKAGVFVIVNGAIWLFCLFMGNLGVAAMVTAIWGAILGIRLWKAYVQTGELPPGVHVESPPVVSPPAAVEPEKAFDQALASPAVSPVPAPTVMGPRVSWSSVWAVLTGIPALIVAIVAGVIYQVGQSGQDVGPFWYWTTLASLGFVSALLGAVAVAWALAGFAMVREARGGRYGRGGAAVGFGFGVVALMVSFAWIRPAVEDAIAVQGRVRAMSEQALASFRESKPDLLWELTDPSESLARDEFDALHRKASLRIKWLDPLHRVGMDPLLQSATVRSYVQRARKDKGWGYSGWSGTLYFRLRRVGGVWRVVELQKLFDDLGAPDETKN